MVVNIKLEFADRQELLGMYFLLHILKCPTKSAQCKECRYYESCLKLRDIANTLGGAINNEE